MILVDTSVWIDFLCGRDNKYYRTLYELIEDGEDIALTGIIITEILQGIRNDKDANRTKEYLLRFPIYNPDTDTYILCAQIYKECQKQGKTVRKTIDCLIAAVAMENDLVLFHNDRDFDSIAACCELKVY